MTLEVYKAPGGMYWLRCDKGYAFAGLTNPADDITYARHVYLYETYWQQQQPIDSIRLNVPEIEIEVGNYDLDTAKGFLLAALLGALVFTAVWLLLPVFMSPFF